MPGCFVPNCSANNRDGRALHMFSFPKDETRRKQWIEAIARVGFEPSKHSKVCELHFREEDITFNTEFLDSKTGITHTAPLKFPRARKTAVPSIFPNRPAAAQQQQQHRPTRIQQQQLSEHDSGCPLLQYLNRQKLSLDFADLSQLVARNAEVAPPEPWNVVTKSSGVNYVNLQMQPSPRVTHLASVNSELQLSLHVDDVEVNSIGRKKFPTAVSNLDRVHDILRDFLKVRTKKRNDLKAKLRKLKRPGGVGKRTNGEPSTSGQDD